MDDIYTNFQRLLTNQGDRENSKNSENFSLKSGRGMNMFNMQKFSKLALPEKGNQFIYKQLENYKHVKSMLGHINMVEDNILPVPIYCLCIGEDDELIFTGDNNGYISLN